ncbi:U20-hexatoxin-Hi1a-like [Parasteatoda tepidariorum]|uniref:U20-hexatoxin-Hi1a-like n=1 Tax=Parasteatoda tepidariorum TaxID=114398 RepID=UPI00077FB8F9|nr:U24-ctenitoxin-Pn1a-like [Parasteatoda tepidariorum]
MNFLGIFVFVCVAATAFSWEFPGYPGVDCPTARERMISMRDRENDPDVRWMLPRCENDGTFKDLQCYDSPGVEDTCMCVAPDGSPLTLPGFGMNVKTCVCFNRQYQVYEHDHYAEMPKCEKNGYFSALQCSKVSGKCWCVDKLGNVLVPPSTQVHSCSKSF